MGTNRIRRKDGDVMDDCKHTLWECRHCGLMHEQKPGWRPVERIHKLEEELRAAKEKIKVFEERESVLHTCYKCKVDLELQGTPESRVSRCVDCPEPESLEEVELRFLTGSDRILFGPIEEVHEALRAEGLDPEKVGRDGAEFVKNLIEKRDQKREA